MNRNELTKIFGMIRLPVHFNISIFVFNLGVDHIFLAKYPDEVQLIPNLNAMIKVIFPKLDFAATF